jgi:hypothetical protein
MQALWMVLAAFFFAGMAVCVKFASTSFSSFELVFFRGLVSLAFMAVVLRASGTPWRTPVPLMHLTRSIVGRALKPPPVAQTFDETTFAPGLTMREKVEKLTRSENCQGCHAVINPLGFSLEHFDAVGRFRTADHGRPIDTSSDYGADELAKPVRLASARDVADFALANARANEAFIEQLFHHLVKQPAAAYGPDTLASLRDSFIASRYNIQNLVVDIASLAALRGTAPALVAATPTRP